MDVLGILGLYIYRTHSVIVTCFIPCTAQLVLAGNAGKSQVRLWSEKVLPRPESIGQAVGRLFCMDTFHYRQHDYLPLKHDGYFWRAELHQDIFQG